MIEEIVGIGEDKYIFLLTFQEQVRVHVNVFY